ncbi:hypothetical protein QOT17_025120 [Balamuthia mandrillaris]
METHHAQGGNQWKEAEVETGAVQSQAGELLRLKRTASRTSVRLFHNALEAGLNGKLPAVRKTDCFLSRVRHPLRSGPQGRGSHHYFCYFHCYLEKKSGKRPGSTSVKGTEAWKAAHAQPFWNQFSSEIGRSLIRPEALSLEATFACGSGVHRLQAHS